jgi:nicotinate-nucleotide adenylyltransferase
LAFAKISRALILKQIGFFGGSFDPIHFGHLHLAIHMFEHYGLQEILFCPAYRSPLKADQPSTALPAHRLEMLKLVLAEIPQFRVTSIEVEKSQISYTVDTLQKLAKAGVQYRLILTDESAASFAQWREPDIIQQLAPPLIGKRAFPISSTEIRERLKKKLYCGHLIPAKALDYIERHGLYF